MIKVRAQKKRIVAMFPIFVFVPLLFSKRAAWQGPGRGALDGGALIGKTRKLAAPYGDSLSFLTPTWQVYDFGVVSMNTYNDVVSLLVPFAPHCPCSSTGWS